MAVTIRFVGFHEATENIRAAYKTGIAQGLVVAGSRGQQLVTDNITSRFLGRADAVSSGELANSIKIRTLDKVDVSGVEVFSEPPGGDYAAYVETGTGRHFPPPTSLLPWVKRTFNISDEKQAMSIAWNVARKIAQRGTSGFGMFARAFNVLDKELVGIFEHSIGEAQLQAGSAK